VSLSLLAALLAVVAAAAVAWVALRRAWEAERQRARLERDGELHRNRIDEVAGRLELARASLEAVAEGVIVVDSALHLVSCNAAARRMLALPARVRGRPLLEVVRSAEIADAATRAVGQARPQSAEVRFAVPGEPERILTLRSLPIVRERGEVERVVSVLSDVTSERRLEQVRRDFVANLSHEFRTPLTAVRGFAETLLMADLAPERRVRFTETIVRHAERLERLVEDLLTLSEIEAGKRPLEPQVIDLVGLAREVVQRLEPELAGAGVCVDVTCDAARVEAWADRRGVEPILQNLLENALKYTREGGSVQVVLETRHGAPCLCVSDTGIGIPSRELSRIFERFYRVDRSRSREVGGSGVGLAIVKHLVELQGGRVEVQSEAERGSSFTVTLAAVPPAAEPPAAEPEGPA
jgi:two-component system phosphate regulon sensor histidine kinase PhoR